MFVYVYIYRYVVLLLWDVETQLESLFQMYLMFIVDYNCHKILLAAITYYAGTNNWMPKVFLFEM